MVLRQTVNIRCPHAVSALMNQAKVTSVTSSRWGNCLATLTAPNIVIQRAPVTNPSSCMMSAMTEFVLEDEGEMTHDCVTLTYAATSEIAETPTENAELELFVDGSAQVIEGNRRAGYAVTSTTEVVASGRLPDHFSAQAAELVALTRACTLASGSVANIYTDSRYAFGVIHDFGVIWQTRKFLTSAGSPIKHAGLVKDLMFAMKIPKKLAVIKVKAHLTTNTTEAKGNALADVAAKQACSYATVQVCSGSTAQKTILPPESIIDLYKDVPLYEAWTWLDKGATVDSSGCWTKGGKYVAPESLLPYLAQQIHSLGSNHCCHIWLNKYTVWVIVVQQRWITGSQINGGIQNSETQPPKQSRDVLHVRKIMMYQQPLHQQHIPQLHQGHFVTCKLITYRCPLVKEKLTFW